MTSVASASILLTFTSAVYRRDILIEEGKKVPSFHIFDNQSRKMNFEFQFLLDNPSTLLFAFRIVTTVFCAIAIFILLRKNKDGQEKNSAKKPLPPGPKEIIPFIGYVPFFNDVSIDKLQEMKKKYGDIFTFKIAGYRFVVLANYELIKEALVEQGVNFSARNQDFSVLNWTVSYSGIFASEAQLWRHHKRFTLQTLRDFGFGRVKLEGQIIEACQSLITYFEKSKGQYCDIESFISNISTNVICNLLYSQIYDFDDPEFVQLKTCFRTMFTSYKGFEMARPRLLSKFLPWNLIRNGKRYQKMHSYLLNVLSKKAEEHENTFDETHIRDYMDAHISKRKQAKAAGDKTLIEYFSADQLKVLCATMILASIEATTTVIYWGFYFLSKNPQVQKRIQNELDEIIGKERLLSYNDLPNLPYTQAVINEVLRAADTIPVSVLHANFEEAVVGGYRIPKRSVIIPSLSALHRDPKYWSDPDGFNPEHFLDSEGKKVRKESFLPFSTGRRLCPGENLARMQIFFFFTLVMQKFDLKFKERSDPFPKTFVGLVRYLLSYELSATSRI